MKKVWKISVAMLFILVVVFVFLYRDALKERISSLTVRDTDLSQIAYDRMSLGRKFRNDSSYTEQQSDFPKLTDYNQHGMNAFYVTTNARDDIVGLKLLDRVPNCHSYFDNGLAMYMTLSKVKHLLGNNYITFNTEKYGKAAMYIDKKHNYKLLLGLSDNDTVTAIVLFNKTQYDYQY